jgi:antitoxin component of MazEF toxin-antitoxin module
MEEIMEIRKLYKQGKSLVVVIPSRYVKALGWSQQDNLTISIVPLNALKIERLETTQPTLII